MASGAAVGQQRLGHLAAGWASVAGRLRLARRLSVKFGAALGPDRVLECSAQNREIAIIGGGIAGASVAAGLVARGITPHIIDARDRLADGASGNRLALQSPRLSVDHNVASRMSADCLSFAAGCSDAALAVVADRVISLDWPDREAVRQAKFRTQFWPDDLMQFVDAKAASSLAGIDLSLGGVLHHWGRVIDPICLTNHLAKGAETHFGFSVVSMRRDDGKYHLVADDGRQLKLDPFRRRRVV